MILSSGLNASAQNQEQQIQKALVGNWEGAFIKNNSYQKIEISFYMQDETLMSLQVMEEWHPAYGEMVLDIQIDSLGTVGFNTGYGRAALKLDPGALELNGSIANTTPSIYLHLKKLPKKPKPNFTTEEITVAGAAGDLYGHLHLPENNPKKTAIIIVGGRGCYAGTTKYDLWAKVLRRYGVAVLSFNKRGTGRSAGNCATATIDDLAQDVATLNSWLRNRPERFKHIGVIGSSAGAWVAAKAQEKKSFDFMITLAGPSTSVYEQQTQSLTYGAPIYELSEEALSEVKAYTDMVFNAPANAASFEQFQKFLIQADQNGWKSLLEDTDIPQSAADIEQLWVRRHNYNPKDVLKKYNNPLLAIYGEKDWIVPYQENINALEEYFKDRPDRLTKVLAHQAGHGIETQSISVNLSDNHTYWRFFRTSPTVMISVIDFLGKHGFIETE
ncbi:alpha/beta hydrolase [Gilvibacter sediminis]|nr:alpha/beta hydrolase [Gilvibacter sediminis]